MPTLQTQRMGNKSTEQKLQGHKQRWKVMGEKLHIQIGASRIKEEGEKSFESKDGTPQKNGQKYEQAIDKQ